MPSAFEKKLYGAYNSQPYGSSNASSVLNYGSGTGNYTTYTTTPGGVDHLWAGGVGLSTDVETQQRPLRASAGKFNMESDNANTGNSLLDSLYSGSGKTGKAYSGKNTESHLTSGMAVEGPARAAPRTYEHSANVDHLGVGSLAYEDPNRKPLMASTGQTFASHIPFLGGVTVDDKSAPPQHFNPYAGKATESHIFDNSSGLGEVPGLGPRRENPYSYQKMASSVLPGPDEYVEKPAPMRPLAYKHSESSLVIGSNGISGGDGLENMRGRANYGGKTNESHFLATPSGYVMDDAGVFQQPIGARKSSAGSDWPTSYDDQYRYDQVQVGDLKLSAPRRHNPNAYNSNVF